MLEDTDIDKIKSANVKNVVRKLQSGKTLTSFDLKALDDARKAPDILVTLNRICDKFGVTRKTIALWRKDGRDCPEKIDGKESLVAWNEWFDNNPDAGSTKGNPKATREDLLSEKIRREIALLDIKVSVARRQVIPADEIDGLLGRIASGQRSDLIQWCETEALTVAGICGGEVGEIRDLMRTICDRLCNTMEAGIRRWISEIEQPRNTT